MSASASSPVRLFVALELPDVTRSALSAWGARVAGSVPGARALAPESLHVTLCFLGATDPDRVAAIGDACVSTAAGADAVELRVGEPLWLPPRRPRVAAVGLVDVSGGLTELQRALTRVLVDGGWMTMERRRFAPHVSVLRIGRRDDPGSAIGSVRLAGPAAEDFRGSRVTLYRSYAGSGGARYEAQASVGLRLGERGDV